jgi:peptidoglycan/LPS O-acetylase OafA/YrhL
MREYHKKGEIASLTGLRGIAALLVMLSHYWFWTAITPKSALPLSIEVWTRTSGIGMAIFFTLSGYVIAFNYSAWDWGRRPTFNLVRLFFYRFARLYPAFVVFAILVILRWPALQDLLDPKAQSYILPHLLLWQAWWPVKYGGAMASDSYFHVSWSLSVECGLYLAFGLGAILVALLPSWRYKRLALGAVFFVGLWLLLDAAWALRDQLMPAGWQEVDWFRWLFLFSPYGVALQFGIGVVACQISRLRPSETAARVLSELGGLGLLAIYLDGVLSGKVAAFNEAMLAALATALVLAGALSGSVTNRLLSGRAIVYVGTISYSVYLFHFITPPLALHARSFETYTPAAAGFHAVNFIAAVGLTILFASGVYFLVEVPGRRAIRAAADRLLGIQQRMAPVAAEQQAPAE